LAARGGCAAALRHGRDRCPGVARGSPGVGPRVGARPVRFEFGGQFTPVLDELLGGLGERLTFRFFPVRINIFDPNPPFIVSEIINYSTFIITSLRFGV
jgi:hypothetical protein